MKIAKRGDSDSEMSQWDKEVEDVLTNWKKLPEHSVDDIRNRHYRRNAEGAFIENEIYPYYGMDVSGLRLKAIYGTLRNRLLESGKSSRDFSVSVSNDGTFIYRLKP
jgi:hypothetical protein